MKPYYLYILKCSDGSLYTGITTDIERRLKEHNNSKKGAKYTAYRRPLELIYQKEFKNRSEALIEEAKIKKLKKEQKKILYNLKNFL
ncbi:endonuclease [Candidatus Falkowbacteria bacterium HGW-Falkowbacteria-1]|uniref:Endonuclease n=1 Tax=Candidatus Falkowbacteria bacterium HGW-Falkowbacteria-1 TaxID=2013768 RepID=A0A2N2E9X8_9BACT|nr:MAG: endonuclease [Candidatus Falkowbacteria bacterium HGW-Falkowbacteria-1]